MRYIELIEQIEYLNGGQLHQRYFVDNGDETLFDRIKYLDVREMQREHHVVWVQDGRVVADLALQDSPYEQDVVWLKHLSVDPEYKNSGLATRLLRFYLPKSITDGKTIEVSSFSSEGHQYLKPLLLRLQKEFPEVKIKMFK